MVKERYVFKINKQYEGVSDPSCEHLVSYGVKLWLIAKVYTSPERLGRPTSLPNCPRLSTTVQ